MLELDGHRQFSVADISESEDEERKEREHFQRIVAAFTYYRAWSLQRVDNRQVYLRSLPDRHQKLLVGYREHLATIRTCIDKNNQIIKLIVQDVPNIFENISPGNPNEPVKPLRPLLADIEKVQATLKQFVRDWSEDGAAERQMCYQPIIDEIVSRFPGDACNSFGDSNTNMKKLGEEIQVQKSCALKDVRVLVPGAGLGRLAYELAKRGYTCQGNEFSLFMLFASNFVLNRCQTVNAYQVYPWVHQYVNNLVPEHQTRAVSFPDVNPADLPSDVEFSMAAGDFTEIYNEENEWNSVATCFFIDCANNVVAFIETIYKILKPGGYWINLGPLLYHFSDLPGEDSIEPSYEVVRQVILGMGFVIEKENVDVKTTYAQNPKSMLQYEYNSVFFVCRKPKPESVEIMDAENNCCIDIGAR